jgi:predicted TIM-barrel fold metal-dependent hydrolase
MWGSNFPIESIWTDYRTLAATWAQALADLPLPDRRNVLAATARRVYRLPVPPPDLPPETVVRDGR